MISFENKVFKAVTDSIILNVVNQYDIKGITKVCRKKNLKFSSSDNYSKYGKEKWNNSEDDYVMNIKMSEKEENIIVYP